MENQKVEKGGSDKQIQFPIFHDPLPQLDAAFLPAAVPTRFRNRSMWKRAVSRFRIQIIQSSTSFFPHIPRQAAHSASRERFQILQYRFPRRAVNMSFCQCRKRDADKGFRQPGSRGDNCRYGIFDLRKGKKRVRSKFDQLRCRGGQGKPSVTTMVRIRPRTSFRGNSIFVIALIGWIVSNKIKQRGGRTAPLFEIASAAYP